MASSSSSSPLIPKCPHISLDEIKYATDNFSKKYFLGKGGEANVYMGEIRVERKMTQVAVKRLSKPESSVGFEREIETVSKFQHPNLVSLLGYCDESGEKILLYEYMEKGSLSSYLKEENSIYFPWVQRLRICLDAARGLQYLHAESDEFPFGIVHRDVKPENILLDTNRVAKISDFGILKLSDADQKQSIVATVLKGTVRYFAPEYALSYRISTASDVFSFGVVLFKVLCLKFYSDRGEETYCPSDDEDLGIWAQQNVDSRIKEEIRDDCLKAFTAIIGQSLKWDRRERPTMDEVVLGLENALKFQMAECGVEQQEGARESNEQSKRTPRLSRQKCCDHISLNEIEYTMDYFDKKRNVLGHGGAGKVYQAKIGIGREVIQVVMKHSKSNSHEEFEKEIQTLSMIQHPNLVSLRGYCDESGQKIFLYKYMEKGRLSSYINEKSSISLSWLQRLRICLGAARGLQHLHAETDEFPRGIIHRNLNPDNILLDENWIARVSGFEMFMFSHASKVQSTMSTNLKGTVWYYAPEYTKSITRKMDVFAFGLVLLQVLCLKTPWDLVDDCYNIDNEDLEIWARKNVDIRIKEEIFDDSLKSFTGIVEQSLKTYPVKRPTMDRVVMDLENVLKFQVHEDEVKRLQNAPRLPIQKYFDHISLDEIKDGTDNFDNRKLIGEGGLGKVYLAEIRLGGKMTRVAVKRYKQKHLDVFEREIRVISRIHHPNVIPILGYCDESGENILLYEYMEKGSLRSYVRKNNYISLPWRQRLSICLDAARGLQHLHTETDKFPKGMIHRDVNPTNILLDNNWEAKISGFSLVKLSHIGQEQSDISTQMKGTAGYFAPEYLIYRGVTRKIDVYAFGIVLFQVLCLKVPWDREEENSYGANGDDLGIWALKNIDTRIKEEISDDSLKTFTAIIGKSLVPNPRKRPNMDEVVYDLENALKCQERHDS